MQTKYKLAPDISRADFLVLLKNLKDDADSEFISLARFHTLHESAEHKAKAMFFAGQMSLLDDMLWALSGEAEQDGCEPTISIRQGSGPLSL